MVLDFLRGIQKAAFKSGLPFFIIFAVFFLAAVIVRAETSLTASCSIPAVPGLNVPMVEEETAKKEQAVHKQEDSQNSPQAQTQDPQVQTAEAKVKTEYSR